MKKVLRLIPSDAGVPGVMYEVMEETAVSRRVEYGDWHANQSVIQEIVDDHPEIAEIVIDRRCPLDTEAWDAAKQYAEAHGLGYSNLRG